MIDLQSIEIGWRQKIVWEERNNCLFNSIKEGRPRVIATGPIVTSSSATAEERRSCRLEAAVSDKYIVRWHIAPHIHNINNGDTTMGRKQEACGVDWAVVIIMQAVVAVHHGAWTRVYCGGDNRESSAPVNIGREARDVRLVQSSSNRRADKTF
ncbi:hypothetical protein J6590_032246 [Homalodisca vitripennis]|nr:hypothetical protein J6590_032246 [Homalodisca vitripennis]